ncbi:MAG: hypothetical protein HYX68_17155, partial [Planctomycetes bacterium]|nr:hypothetical protein [Planctomycetota bacterium]
MQTPIPISPNPPPRRRRWWLAVLGFVASLVLGPVGWWIWSQVAMQNAWDAAVAEAEQDIPRWRLMELEADRPTV